MGIKRNLDQTVECADESLTEVKDPKRAKIDAWLARRQATITAFMQKEPAHTPPRRMTQQTARKSAPPTGAHLYMLKTIEVNQGLDTSESMEKAASSKPSLENQVKALKDQNDQIRKVLKQAIDSLPGDLADVRTSLEAVYKLTEPSPPDPDATHKQAERMYKRFLKSAEVANEDLWEEFYNDPRDSYAWNADSFAEAMADCLPDVEALLQQPDDVGVIFAFDLMMFLADHVHGELDIKGGSGYGDSEESYALMDAMMMRVIARRLQLKDACQDTTWMTDTRQKLEKKRIHLDQYGLENYFSDTIKCLGELDGSRVEDVVVIE